MLWSNWNIWSYIWNISCTYISKKVILTHGLTQCVFAVSVVPFHCLQKALDSLKYSLYYVTCMQLKTRKGGEKTPKTSAYREKIRNKSQLQSNAYFRPHLSSLFSPWLAQKQPWQWCKVLFLTFEASLMSSVLQDNILSLLYICTSWEVCGFEYEPERAWYVSKSRASFTIFPV